MPVEAIRIKRTDLNLAALQDLLREVEADLFKKELKQITGLTLADPAGPDAGHNVIVTDEAGSKPPAVTLRQFPLELNEEELAGKLVEVEDREKLILRSYATVLVGNQPAAVALFDPAPAPEAAAAETITIRGKMSVFGGPKDTTMTLTENLAWIDNEQQAADYPGFFLPRRGKEGFGRRLRTEKYYLACRWDYSVTPKRFLAQPTTLCTVKNPANGKTVQARPIDWGPDLDRTGRNADLSNGVADALGLRTNDVCEVLVPTPRQAPRPAVPAVTEPGAASGRRRVVFLTGDYALRRVRQRQAAAEGCALTVDFHFNSNGPAAYGGEVYHKRGDAASRRVAERIVAGFRSIGLPDHGSEPVKSGGRAGFIDAYANPAVLLEPLFVSNPKQAAWLHDAENFQKLAKAVAQVILESTCDKDTIGLSIGHLGKDSSPNDRGATCRGGDTEATHGEALARAVAELLA